ncbi:hypothetical protein AnigIFM63604_003194 [Aspergillus niger]|uniref:NACHT domain-containing protein n=1 Tax=Aspergillus niger TaxID=5061 RepID=A0A9W6E8W2_ASPNG|nr:hypothetical protein AnigIFM63604_003194 [Aspergillus niger]
METTEDVAVHLSERLSVTVADITVRSLARSLEHWEKSPTKVATVMFKVHPSCVQEKPAGDQWYIPAMGNNPATYRLHTSKDCHPSPKPWEFNLPVSCIAISGLASHPFGSWQPKGDDKEFMWILDKLAHGEQSVRAILFGYDTKLKDSTSFQGIRDLAKHLIDQLQANRGPKCETPLAFLAHSLGGLVVKQALVDLAKNRFDIGYQILRDAIRGAIFFGVPSQGMEVSAWKAIVQGQPNEIMINALSSTSDFIPKLTKAFNETLPEHCRFFWAYETEVTPTAITEPDGQVARKGEAVKLVSEDSATCGFIKSDPGVTIPINKSHSDMVKFCEGSQYYAIVRASLWQVLQPTLLQPDDTDYDAQCMSNPTTERLSNSSPRSMTAALNEFRSISNFTESDTRDLARANANALRHLIVDIQCGLSNVPDRKNRLYRLESFLKGMEQFDKLVEEIELFSHSSNSIAYVWCSMRYILETVYGYPKQFDSILETYQLIGDGMPEVDKYQGMFVQSPYLEEVLVDIYKNVLLIQAEIIRHLKLRRGSRRHQHEHITEANLPIEWDQLFDSWFQDYKIDLQKISHKLDGNKKLIENNASQKEAEIVRMGNSVLAQALRSERETRTETHKDRVKHWLSAFDIQAEHHIYKEKWKDCRDPGRWLLNSPEFKLWTSADNKWAPLLWLSGIPGAGKSVLASIVIDKLKNRGAPVAYFYCKYGDDRRASVESVTRSILAQVLDLNPDLLPYFHQNAQMNVSLSSPPSSEQILGTSLRSLERVYLVLDGLDECGSDAGKAIASRFLKMVNLEKEVGSIRCLFISQDDGAAAVGSDGFQSINVGNKNSDDIKEFVGKWQQKLITKFGVSKRLSNLQEIISKRAKGKFIFAELFVKYLYQQQTTEDFNEQFRPRNLPVTLDSLYERILGHARKVRDPHTATHIDEILGWIVCARRPLRWEEIQTAVCIDPERREFDIDRQLNGSPEDIFASLVERHPNETVDLVHQTAQQYLTKERKSTEGLIREPEVNVHKGHYSLAVRCLTYLSLRQFHLDRSKPEIKSDLREGFHQLYDYASACWAMHLEGAVFDLGDPDLTRLHQTLRKMIKLHWFNSYKPIQSTKKVRKLLSPFEKLVDANSRKYDRLLQAVAWAKKLSGPSGKGLSDKDALTLWKVTANIRLVLEDIDDEGDDWAIIKDKYGVRRFKCARINCYYYHHGFRDFDQRERHTLKHTRPYLCVVAGCQKEAIGYAREENLREHLRGAHHITDDSDEDDEVNEDYPKPWPQQATGISEAPIETEFHQKAVCKPT